MVFSSSDRAVGEEAFPDDIESARRFAESAMIRFENIAMLFVVSIRVVEMAE